MVAAGEQQETYVPGSINPPSYVEMKPGEKFHIETSNVTWMNWSTSNVNVAWIEDAQGSGNYNITAYAEGDAVITITHFESPGGGTWDGSRTIQVHVEEDKTPYIDSYDSTKIVLQVGESATREFKPKDYSKVYFHFEQWNKTTSDIVDVTTLDQDGDGLVDHIKVTAKKAGSTELTGEAQDINGDHKGAYTDPPWYIDVYDKLTATITCDDEGKWTNKEKETFTIEFSEDVEDFTEDDIYSNYLTNLQLTKINNKKYTLVATNPDFREGLQVYVKAGSCRIAGTSFTNQRSNIIIYNVDKIKPEVKFTSVTSDKNTKHYNKEATVYINFKITDNYGFNANAQDIELGKNFNLYIIEGTEKTKINSNVQLEKIDSRSSYREYKATITNLTQDQGKLDFEILNDIDAGENEVTHLYDYAGNTFDSYTYSKDTENYKEIIIDNVPPTLKDIEYDQSGEWKTKQEILVEAEDNCAPKEEITVEYIWKNTTKEEEKYRGTVANQTPIVKDTNYGVYQVAVKYIDLAGNYDIKLLSDIKLDAALSDTEMGAISVKNKNTNTQYPFPEEKINGVYQGGYTNDTLQIEVVKGTVDEGKESGHKTTTYQVYKKVGNEFVVVGKETSMPSTYYDDGTYKVIVTSKDMVENSRNETYMIYKGVANVTFGTNGGTGTSASTTVTVNDNNHTYTEISYTWIKEGEEITEDTEWTPIENGETVTFSPKEKGKWNLYVKTVDENGNVNITKSATFTINGKIDEPGTVTFKEDNENGKEITATEGELLSNKNIWIDVENGTDSLGTVETTYKVTKNNQIVVGNGTSESTTLTEEGVYNLVVTSRRTNDNLVETEEYTITIDKTKPQVTFTPASEENAQVGKLKVDVADNEGIEDARSGLNEESLRYYWVQGFVEPQDFDEAEDEYRGKFTNGSVITAPSGSGIWVLWIYAEDNAGNIVKDKSIIRDNSNQTVSDNEVTKVGTLEIKKSNGQNYRPAIEGEEGEAEYTNLNLDVKILAGYDKENGVVSNTYKIKKDGTTLEIDGKDEFDGEVTLNEHGTYVATVTTVDGAGNTATKVYTMKIDQNGPVINFEPDGNTTFAKQHEVEVSITDDKTTTEIGTINTSATKYVWIGYNDETETIDTIRDRLYQYIQSKMIVEGEFVEEISDTDSIAELENIGIYVIPTTVSNKVKTPEGKTGKYVLYVYAEDSLGNSTLKASKEFSIDNTKPTKPEIRGVILEDRNYYGQKVNTEVKVIAENSKSLSGVDRYEYSYTTDGGENWSEWTDGTQDDDKIFGQVIVDRHGKTVVKFRSIAELLDGELVSDETDEFTVVIDKKGPDITFKNENDGKNGSEEEIENIKVRVTATDEEEIQVNPNTLKYIWTKFDSVADYEEKVQSKEFLSEKIEEGTKFVNGSLISSPENVSGIYGLLVYAEDSLGNATLTSSNYYNLKSDNEGPEITFANTENEENGSTNNIEKIKVRVTVTDESGVAEETLKYNWIKFDTIESYIEYEQEDKTIEQLKEKMQIDNALTFSNGEPIASPDGIEGVYSLFIYAKDQKDNETITYSKYYAFNLSQEESLYKLEGKYIKRVIPGTTVSEMTDEVKLLIPGTSYKFFNKGGDEISGNTKVTTGSTVEVDEKSYTIVVIGDLNGDGKLNGVDVVRMRFYRVGKYDLNEAYLKAADINNDEKVNGVDLLKIRQLNVGLADFTN